MRTEGEAEAPLFITFQAGDLSLALPMEEVEEVLPATGLQPLRGAHRWVAGVLIRRGRAVGVVDPAALAGRPGGRRRELLILAGRPGLALIGEGTDAVTRDHRIEPGPEQETLPGVSKMLRCAGGSYSLLDVERLRRHLGAELRGEEHDEQDPAGR